MTSRQSWSRLRRRDRAGVRSSSAPRFAEPSGSWRSARLRRPIAPSRTRRPKPTSTHQFGRPRRRSSGPGGNGEAVRYLSGEPAAPNRTAPRAALESHAGVRLPQQGHCRGGDVDNAWHSSGSSDRCGGRPCPRVRGELRQHPRHPHGFAAQGPAQREGNGAYRTSAHVMRAFCRCANKYCAFALFRDTRGYSCWSASHSLRS